jgi:hypothetical protein
VNVTCNTTVSPRARESLTWAASRARILSAKMSVTVAGAQSDAMGGGEIGVNGEKVAGPRGDESDTSITFMTPPGRWRDDFPIEDELLPLVPEFGEPPLMVQQHR